MSWYHEKAEGVEIEAEEDGWHLVVTDSDGDKLDFHIHAIAFDFAGSKGLRDLLEWRGEGESIRAEVRAARGDLQADEGYELDDPKHPTYRERMAGLADDR